MNRKGYIGLALVLVGTLFLLNGMGIFMFTFDELVGRLVPFSLIALGAWLIVRKKRQLESRQEEVSGSYTIHGQAGPEEDMASHKSDPGSTYAGAEGSPRVSAAPQAEDGTLKFSNIIGDLLVDCAGLDLKNIVISAFIGETEVRLHGGKLLPGLNRMILSGFIGDIRILVPKTMPVFIHCSNFVGDIDLLGKRTSGIGNQVEAQTDGYSEASDKLYVAVSCFIADIRVYTV